jgi:hypothetical protein
MSKKEPVHLKGTELETARRALTDAQETLLSLAGLVLRALESDRKVEHVRRIVVHPGNAKAVFYNDAGLCIGVVEDPPGVCRPCGPNENVQWA